MKIINNLNENHKYLYKIVGLNIFILLLVVASIVFVYYAQASIHKKSVWQDKKEPIIIKVATLGGDDIKSPDYMFGHIADVEIDDYESIFILDFVNKRVSKFNRDGRFVRHYGKGKGQGPGEFQFPANVAIDSKGYVYICDSIQRKIEVFDESGNYIRTIKTIKNVKPINDMKVYKDKYLIVGIDVENYLLGWKEGIFMIYELPEGKYLKSIGSYDWFIDKENWNTYGAANSISIDKRNSNIIISHTLPYRIEVFNDKWQLINTFGRHIDYFETLLTEPISKIRKVASGASLCVTCFPNGNIINAIRHITRYNAKDPTIMERYFDVFDEHGKYLISIPEKKFGIQGLYNMVMNSDNEGNLWISINEPFPHLAKFHIEIN